MEGPHQVLQAVLKNVGETTSAALEKASPIFVEIGKDYAAGKHKKESLIPLRDDIFCKRLGIGTEAKPKVSFKRPAEAPAKDAPAAKAP
eukprot:14969741-Alexandrium_andersonii.AAC.1